MAPMADYIQAILIPCLTQCGVAEDFIEYTAHTIEAQGTSLLRNWDDIAFRRTVLLVGSEEGSFYEPADKYDIKCFVVMAIRNSPIETIQSDNSKLAGLSKPISSDKVKSITSDAIRYFSKKDFSTLCQDAKDSPTPDLYRDITARYPVAWSALSHLATSSAKVVPYEKVPFAQPYPLNGSTRDIGTPPPEYTGGKAMVRSVFDAYGPELDPQLIALLHSIAEDNSVFAVDSFKTATRNFENLLKIMEFLLTHGNAFVTSNYYLENGHVERRVKLLRAAHTFAQMERNTAQLSGLGRKHAAALKNLHDQK